MMQLDPSTRYGLICFTSSLPLFVKMYFGDTSLLFLSLNPNNKNETYVILGNGPNDRLGNPPIRR